MLADLRDGLARLLPGILVIAVGCFPGAQAAPRAGGRPPNVVLLMTDQQYFGVLGSSGNGVVKTPNLDRLAREGTRFSMAVCATPFCSPTRASIRTGQWPHKHGIVHNVRIGSPNRNSSDKPEPLGIGDRHVTLDNRLFDHGYRLRHLGKWHLGDINELRCYRDQPDRRQERKLYNVWRKGLGTSVLDRTPRGSERFHDEVGGVFMTPACSRFHNVWKNEERRSTQDLSIIGRSAIAPQAQYETWLTDQAIDWIEEHADEPFMLTLSVGPPHAFWIAPDPYYGMYDPARMRLPASFGHRPDIHLSSQPARMGALMGESALREYLRCYYAQVSMVDQQFGRVLDKLRNLGLEADTLVIFTSDHGDMQAAHGMVGKTVNAYYEELVRVPLIVRFPETIPSGGKLDMAANSVDLMPTVLDYAGLQIPETVQGRSLRPFLEERIPPDDEAGFCERLVSGPHASRMIRTRLWKFSIWGDGRMELFDLERDPAEMTNLADKARYRDQRDKLEKRLRDWMERTDDPALETLFGEDARQES